VLKVVWTLERKQIIKSKSLVLSYAEISSSAVCTPGQQVLLFASLWFRQWMLPIALVDLRVGYVQ